MNNAVEPDVTPADVLPTATSTGPRARLSRRLVTVFAVAVGASVANLYYVQPVLPTIQHEFHLSAGVAGLAVTWTQLGYMLGLAFILPLGDLLERRRLVTVLALGCAGALALAAAAPDVPLLFLAMAFIGALSVVSHTLVPFVATLAPDHERGRVIGSVMSGLLIGILLARTVSGFIAAASSWRVVFLVAAGAMAGIAVLLRSQLPRSRSTAGLGYGRLLASLVEIVRSEPLLRRRMFYGVASMGSFSLLWTSVAFLLAGPPYHYHAATIGMFGLVGASGAIMANVAGRQADRGRVRGLTVFSAAALTGSFVLLWVGRNSLAALIVGIVVLDAGAQAMQITNQSEIFRLRPDARTRLNAVYMTAYFLGATGASALSALLYQLVGWPGVAGAGVCIGAAALSRALYDARRPLASVHAPPASTGA